MTEIVCGANTWPEVVLRLGAGGILVTLVLGLVFAAVLYSKGRP